LNETQDLKYLRGIFTYRPIYSENTFWLLLHHWNWKINEFNLVDTNSKRTKAIEAINKIQDEALKGFKDIAKGIKAKGRKKIQILVDGKELDNIKKLLKKYGLNSSGVTDIQKQEEKFKNKQLRNFNKTQLKSRIKGLKDSRYKYLKTLLSENMINSKKLPLNEETIKDLSLLKNPQLASELYSVSIGVSSRTVQDRLEPRYDYVAVFDTDNKEYRIPLGKILEAEEKAYNQNKLSYIDKMKEFLKVPVEVIDKFYAFDYYIRGISKLNTPRSSK